MTTTTTTDPRTWAEAHATHTFPGTFGCPFCLTDQRERMAHDAEIRDDIASAQAFEDAFHGEVTMGDGGKCRRCAGTGAFITYVENGVPKGPGGPCFRCNGKGYQTEDDRRRNWGYDNFGVRIAM